MRRVPPPSSYVWLLLVAVAILTPGCGNSTESANDSAAAPTSAAVKLENGLHSWTAPDGATLPYEVSGAGETTVIFVHCWMCDRSFWNEQVPVVQKEYRVITLDLPGHGAGSDDRTDWKVEAFGRDVAGLIEELDLTDVILVGHSMGGPVVLKTAALAQERIKGIVAVDTLQNAEINANGNPFGEVGKMFAADYEGACNGMIGQMFVEQDVEPVIEHVRQVACTDANGEAGSALIGDFGNLDLVTWFSEAGVPIRAINAKGPQPTLVEVNQKYADFEVVFMDDVGHYPHMTRPEAFNPHLLRYLRELAAAA